MKFHLITVNMPTCEVNMKPREHVYESMAALVAYVRENHAGWTSLVVTVTPH